MRKTRIVIIGGGFAGVKCAKTLRKRLSDAAEITLFSRENHMVFQPLLPDVAGSSLNPRAVAPPLRLLLPGVTCRTEDVQRVDLDHNQIVHDSHDGTPRTMAYDHLVIACGNVVNLNLLPGMANHALPLKTIGDAIAMRAHVMQQLEKADLAETEEQRRFYLTFIVVGGGFSGVEVAGELNDLILSSLKHYPNIRRDDVMVTLLHGQSQILPEVSPKLRDFAHQRMVARGIKVLCDSKVIEVTKRGAILDGGNKVQGATIICTVGTTASALVAAMDVPKERGRLLTDPDTRLQGRQNVWAVGDCAMVPNAHDNKPAPPTAQYGERAGKQCAENLIRALRGEPTVPFNYKPVGIACGIGGRKAVAEIFGMHFSGFIAWWLWRSSFLLKIPSIAQKIKVGIDWAWELVFPRDLSHFKPVQSDPISKAHFAPGEILFHHNQPLKELYAIEAGEAEIAQRNDFNGEFRSLQTLPAGSVIGEVTLAEYMSENTFVRARTALDVYVLGKDSLTRLSKALAPVEEIIERAVKRPRVSIWRHHPTAMQALAARCVAELPTSYPLLSADVRSTLGAVYHQLIEQKHGCVVITDMGRIVGIATRSDLLSALARGATRDTPVREAMNTKFICMAHSDSAAKAAERMADDGLKFLPVVDDSNKPISVLTSDDFVRFALAMPR